jgi:hypothetical protein
MSEDIIFEIKRDPNPPQKRTRVPGLANAMRNMTVGTYIDVPARMKASIYPVAKRIGINVTIRKMGEIIRVWRVA